MKALLNWIMGQAYLEPASWTRRSILTTARMGKFSCDRAIQEYCKDIWQVHSVSIDLNAYRFDAGGCQLR